MPYKIDTYKVKLPRELDRRIKLQDEQKEEVKEMFKIWVSINNIAQNFEVSRRLIQYIIYPERLEHAKELYAIRRLDGRYYDKDKQRESIKSTRHHRQKNLSI